MPALRAVSYRSISNLVCALRLEGRHGVRRVPDQRHSLPLKIIHGGGGGGRAGGGAEDVRLQHLAVVHRVPPHVVQRGGFEERGDGLVPPTATPQQLPLQGRCGQTEKNLESRKVSVVCPSYGRVGVEPRSQQPANRHISI
eukprot:5992606-Pyramimonas_sp.AAC.1